MRNRNLFTILRIAGNPVHSMLAASPIAFFTAAMVTDVTYWRSADPLWSTMSSWLLLAGLVMAYAAVWAGLIDVLGDQKLRARGFARTHSLGGGLAVLLATLNFVFHVRDGYSAVVPAGPLLSAAVVLVMLPVGWMGRDLLARRQVAVVRRRAADRKEP